MTGINIGGSHIKGSPTRLGVLAADRRPPRKSYVPHFLLLAVVVFPGLSQGTTIVAIWTPDRIIIASDSKPTCADDTGKIVECPAGSKTICKIEAVGSFRYATAGLYAFPLTNFSVPKIARKAFDDSTKSGIVNLVWFSQEFSISLNEALAEARTKAAALQAVRTNINFNSADYIVVGLMKSGLRIIHQRSDISESELRKLSDGVKIFSFPEEGEILPSENPKGLEAVMAGETAEIVTYQVQHPEWAKMNAVDAARKFIQLEIDAHPAQVGPPITIYAIEKDGTVTPIDPEPCEHK